MQLAFITIILSLCFSLLPAAAPASPADPRAADAAYTPAAQVKIGHAEMDDLPSGVADTSLVSAAGHTSRVTAETAGAASAQPLVDQPTPNIQKVWSLIASIAQQYKDGDPFYVFDQAYAQLNSRELDLDEDIFEFHDAYQYFAHNKAKLQFLEKLLLHHHHVSCLPDGASTVLSTAEKYQYHSYTTITPTVKAKLNELYLQHIATLRTYRSLLPPLWDIVIAYGGVPAWGASLDEAYSIQQQIYGQDSRVLNLKGYGIYNTKSHQLQGQHFHTIDLSFNFISELPPNAIPCSSNQLFLYDNPLQSVASGAFTNQPYLIWLFLCNSTLDQVVPGTFRGLAHLIRLDISNCNIQHMDPRVLDDLYCLRGLTTSLPYASLPCVVTPQKLPFLEDQAHFGCQYLEPHPGYREQFPFLNNPEFWQLREGALKLLSAVESNLCSFPDGNLEQSLADRNAHMPRIIARMRVIIQNPIAAHRETNRLEDPLLPQETNQNHSCCAVS